MAPSDDAASPLDLAVLEQQARDRLPEDVLDYFVGRPVIRGLTVGGAPGVSDVLSAPTAELAHTMTLCGLSDVRSVPRDTVVRAHRAG